MDAAKEVLGQLTQYRKGTCLAYPMDLGYSYQILQYPTIGLSLTVKTPPDIIVRANPAQSQTAGEWRYTDLFMPQDHLDFRWEKATGNRSEKSE